MMGFKQIKKVIEVAWSKETSADPDNWTPENPAYGQCAVTALIVQDCWGGKLLKSKVNGVSHYYNKLDNGFEIDLTRIQFKKPVFEGKEIKEREYVLSFPDTAARYKLLKQNIKNIDELELFPEFKK